MLAGSGLKCAVTDSLMQRPILVLSFVELLAIDKIQAPHPHAPDNTAPETPCVFPATAAAAKGITDDVTRLDPATIGHVIEHALDQGFRELGRMGKDRVGTHAFTRVA